MRRADRSKDPRFTTAAARRQNLDELHAIVQTWISTFPDMAALDAQLDEAKIAMGEIRSLRELGESEWADYWGAVQEVPARSGDRKSVVLGKSVSVRVDVGGRRSIKKNIT